MISEKLKRRLDIWCDRSGTRFSRVYFKEYKDGIVVKRYDGNGLPFIIHSFKNDDELSSFLNESDELKKILDEYNEELEKKILI